MLEPLRRFFFRLLSPKDLLPEQFPATSWETGATAASLEKLRSYVAAEAKQAADWYIRKRSFKRRAGQATRLGAMIAGATAGILPVFAQILGQDGKYAFSPSWATVLLAAAALLVTIDYFFGYTSGWVRYLEASQKIVRCMYDFQFDWEMLRTNWVGHDPSTEEVRAALQRLKGAAIQVHQVIQEETTAWAAEFRSTVQRLDEAARARAESAPSAVGVNVTVTNGADIGVWTLALDDGERTPGSGARRALLNIRPGSHKFVAEGRVNNQVVRDEVIAEVRPTGVTEISLTLH
jgi:4-amino-4-deoxy-L-arabinose transferase-like glycosyltransferase